VRRLPIPYVPVVDEVQDTLALKKECYEAFTLSNGTKFKVHIWDAGTPEEFLIHVKEALNACERLGHFEEHKQAYLTREKASQNSRKQERLVRKPFPLPKISTVLQELEGFTFATALDLNMGYYTIRLDPDASRICTIIFPWGK
jgi:hypothetical protein